MNKSDPKRDDLPPERVVLDAIEEEELSIAQELHDTVCQSLSGLRLSAAALRRKLPEVQGAAADEFAHLERVAARVIGELHEIVRSLQPADVAPAELSFALEDLARDLKPLIRCDYRCVGRPAVADGFAASQVLRIVRALARHVIATKSSKHLTIEWEEGVNDSRVSLTADHASFAELQEAPAWSLRWKLVQRRAAAIGGALTVEHGGTALVLKLPGTA